MKTVTLKTLAQMINDQLPQYEARVEESSHTYSPPLYKGSRVARYHRTKHGKSLRVYEKGKTYMRPVFELNKAIYYAINETAMRWFVEHGGTIEGFSAQVQK